ncbi:MAG: T9SS type A sorting domain-containing protein [Candidatus Neomarinimicrobiota bacterium]
MKRIVIATLVAMLLISSVFAAKVATLPVGYKARMEQVVKEKAGEIYNASPTLAKVAAKTAAAYEPAFEAVLIDSSKNGFGMVSGITNPVSHNGETFVMAYRQWAGLNATAGLIGAAISQDGGANWSVSSNLNATSPGESAGRYPSAIGAGAAPVIIWNEYVGESSGLESDAIPLLTLDQLGWGGGYFSTPAVIGVNATNPEGLWMGCPCYSEDGDGNGHLNVSFSTWREFDANDVSSKNIYLYNSSSVGSEITFNPFTKIFDTKTYFEEGSSSGSTTSDALISIADNGIGYIANVAYWGSNYADKVEGNAYHTFKFRKTTDHGQTWSETSFDDDVPYYYIKDSVFDENIFDVYIPSEQYNVTNADGDTLLIDKMDWDEDLYTMIDTSRWPGLFIGYDNDMIVDADGGVHFMCLVIPESEEAGYIVPTAHEGCGFYHLYCADPTLESAEWEVSFVTSMQHTWLFPYRNGTSAWQSFFPAMATSTEDPNVIYAVYPKGDTFTEEDPESPGDTLIYKVSYDVFVRRSLDAGKTWQEEINVTNTPNYDELNAHADPDATDDNVYIVYHVPDYSTHTVDNDTTDAVPEDYKNRIYFMNVDYTSAISGTSVADVPTNFDLLQNYPNPFNPVTSIAFNIHEAGEYSLDIYNTLGQKVKTLVSDYRSVGRHEVQFDASAMSSGIYFYSLKNDKTALTRKLVLLK